MVFIFDKGILISTRDRRSRSQDPLETYLQAYGFFTPPEWDHINYVAEHSSLDLTEILISEGLLNEQNLTQALQGLAQEMTVAGMRLKRGRYNFNPTSDTPPGVKWKLKLDVQGLLMEAARRMDEETILREYFPSQAISFLQGNKVLPPEGASETSTKILELALAGLPLGRIIRQGQAESFVVRNLLKAWCEEGVLNIVEASAADDEDDHPRKRDQRKLSHYRLRSTPITMFIIMILGVAGWLRWTALPAPDPEFGRNLRERQLRDEVVQAAQLYRYAHGDWPANLQELVKNGALDNHTLTTVNALGWTYKTTPNRKAFTLG